MSTPSWLKTHIDTPCFPLLYTGKILRAKYLQVLKEGRCFRGWVSTSAFSIKSSIFVSSSSKSSFDSSILLITAIQPRKSSLTLFHHFCAILIHQSSCIEPYGINCFLSNSNFFPKSQAYGHTRFPTIWS